MCLQHAQSQRPCATLNDQHKWLRRHQCGGFFQFTRICVRSFLFFHRERRWQSRIPGRAKRQQCAAKCNNLCCVLCRARRRQRFVCTDCHEETLRVEFQFVSIESASDLAMTFFACLCVCHCCCRFGVFWGSLPTRVEQSGQLSKEEEEQEKAKRWQPWSWV